VRHRAGSPAALPATAHASDDGAGHAEIALKYHAIPARHSLHRAAAGRC